MASFYLFKLSFIVSALFSSSNLASFWPQKNGDGFGVSSPTCIRNECPSYDVVQGSDGFEIRRYNFSMWVSTQPIYDISLVDAARIGSRLFDYIQSKKDNQQNIQMTAPVITEVEPGDGPFCVSSFVVSFYVSKENQATAPSSAKGLRLRRWGPTYIAVRQFIIDGDVGEQAAALCANIAKTVWSDAIDKSRKGAAAVKEYIVAQYNNSPFEFRNRVNEIWLTFDLEDGLAI